MKVRDAVKKAWKIYIGHFGAMLEFMLLETVLRLIVLTPLLFLVTKEMKLLALISIPLFVLIVPPVRQCAAEVMQEAVRGGDIFSARLVVTGHYGQKVWNGVKQSVLSLLWAAPFIAATAWALKLFFGEAVVGQSDVFTIMITISNLGNGDIVRGVILVMLIYAALFVPFLVGCAFHSGRRHERALGEKKIIRGHRGGVMLTWLVSAVTVVPFAAVTGVVGFGYLKALVSAVSNMMNGLVLPPLDQNAYVILGAFVVLMLPLIPLKSLMTACYVHGLWEGNE